MADEITPDFIIKANDRLPVIEAVLGYAGTTTGPNLTLPGVTVDFIMRLADPAGLPADGVLPRVNARATITNPTQRIVRYSWKAGDTAVPGRYLGEWEVHDAAGLAQTFPVDGYHVIDVLEDLDSDSNPAVA